MFIKISSFFVLLFAFCFILMMGCSVPSLNEKDSVNNSVSGISKSYGSVITAAGTVGGYCYSSSDLVSLKSLATQNAIASWESYAKSSWGQAVNKSFRWLVDPSFSGSNYYFVYVQASGCPYIQDPPTPTIPVTISGPSILSGSTPMLWTVNIPGSLQNYSIHYTVQRGNDPSFSWDSTSTTCSFSAYSSTPITIVLSVTVTAPGYLPGSSTFYIYTSY